jgi:heme oxygenase (biliverdin-producing, ferredoxin)
MSLKEITKDLHTDAERTEFAKKLLSGSISKEDYANYLYQMMLIYNPIELGNRILGNFQNLPDIERTAYISQDFYELAGFDHDYRWLPSAIAYHNYLLQLIRDSERQHLIKAHLYCRHMGDLYGGQIIAKRVPGNGRFYQFRDADKLKEQIRAELTDDLGDEARVAFEWAIKIMKELNDEPSLVYTD